MQAFKKAAQSNQFDHMILVTVSNMYLTFSNFLGKFIRIGNKDIYIKKALV